VAQKYLAAARDTAVSAGDTASEGGAWCIAVLAAFQARRTPEQTLTDYLASEVFAGADLITEQPVAADVAGFDAFLQRYVAALPVQRAAVERS
jgi:hypothetical protein